MRGADGQQASRYLTSPNMVDREWKMVSQYCIWLFLRQRVAMLQGGLGAIYSPRQVLIPRRLLLLGPCKTTAGNKDTAYYLCGRVWKRIPPNTTCGRRGCSFGLGNAATDRRFETFPSRLGTRRATLLHPPPGHVPPWATASPSRQNGLHRPCCSCFSNPNPSLVPFRQQVGREGEL